MNIGKRFKSYRIKANLSQLEAAKLIGVKNYQLGNYETNRSEPSIATLKKMSEVYNVSIDALVGNLRVKKPKEVEEQADMDELLNELAEVVDKMKKANNQ